MHPATFDPDGPASEEIDAVREQSMLDGAQTFVQGRAGVTGQDIDRLLRDDRPVIDELVDEMHGDPGAVDPGGQRVSHRVGAAEGRQQRRMDVDDTVRPTVEECCGQDAHEAGEHDEVGAGRGDGVSEARLPACTIGPVERDGMRRDACLAGTLEGRCVVYVAEHSDEFSGDLASADRCDERDEVAARSGGEDGDARGARTGPSFHVATPIVRPLLGTASQTVQQGASLTAHPRRPALRAYPQ